jgi:phosphonate transport system substrate-binding protein
MTALHLGNCPTTTFTRRDWIVQGAAWVLTPGMAAAQSGVIRFGLTPVFLDDRVRLLRQWAQYLEGELGRTVVFVQFGSYAQVMDALRGGQLEFAWVCGYPYVLNRRELQLVSVPLWRKAPLYQSYLIADKASKVRTVDDLRDRTFAYSDPLSNSGFLFVQHLLRSKGFDPTQYFKRSFFTYSHRNVVEAVSEGLAEAGAVDGYVWETLAEISPAVTARTRVMLRSNDFGFPPIVAPSGLASSAVLQFAQVLKQMPSTALGRLVLKDLRLDGFDIHPSHIFDGIEDMTRHTRG